MRKINWKALGKHVLTLGIGWAIDRFLAKKVPLKVAAALNAITDGAGDKVPKELHDAVDRLMEAKIRASLGELPATVKHLEDSLTRALDRGKK